MTNHASHVKTVLALLQSPAFLRATLSGPQRLQKSPIQRVAFRAIQLHEKTYVQVSRFDARKDLTENVLPENLPAALADVLPVGFANAHITTLSEEIDLRFTKKLALHVARKKRQENAPHSLEPHNRTKILPLPENTPDHLLQVMGIMTADGKIRPTMQSKFTQINEFLKLLTPLLDRLTTQDESEGITSPGPAPLTILDFGSGSAYLTLALHHYLTHIRNIPAQIAGIDINDTLIQKSLEKAHTLNLENLTFRTPAAGREDQTLHRADIVLALHACDTATDEALALAINVEAKIILAAPCCHKNLNHIHIEALAPLHRHGILHQRLADLITDTFRALLLRIMGYKTDVIEFIAPEHTARNLMIRALKTKSPPIPQLFDEYRTLKTLTGVTPHLQSLLFSLPAAAR